VGEVYRIGKELVQCGIRGRNVARWDHLEYRVINRGKKKAKGTQKNHKQIESKRWKGWGGQSKQGKMN